MKPGQPIILPDTAPAAQPRAKRLHPEILMLPEAIGRTIMAEWCYIMGATVEEAKVALAAMPQIDEPAPTLN